jgi:hypothetical protein
MGSSGASTANQSPELQAAFVKRLEELLFKTSKSVEAYADTMTLDRRLQVLITAMQKRKAKMDQPASGASKSAIHDQQQAASKGRRSTLEQQKREVLRKILGQDKMNRIFKVVAEIKLIQLGRKSQRESPMSHFLCVLEADVLFPFRAPAIKKLQRLSGISSSIPPLSPLTRKCLWSAFPLFRGINSWHKEKPGWLPTTSGFARVRQPRTHSRSLCLDVSASLVQNGLIYGPFAEAHHRMKLFRAS